MQYKIICKAGLQKRQVVSGKTLVLMSLGVASSVDIVIESQGFASEEIRGVRNGLKIRGNAFSSISITSTVDTTVEVFASNSDLSVNYVDGAEIKAQITAWPTEMLHVSNDRGAPESPLYVVSSATAPAASLNNSAHVAVGDAAVLVATANNGRLSLRLTNFGPNPVAIGGSGLTWEMRCIVLESGDYWVDDNAQNLEWYAITDTGKAASIATQEVVS